MEDNSAPKHMYCRGCSDEDCVFNHLTQEELILLNDNITLANFSKGELIFKQGTFVSHVAFLRKGLAKTVIEDDNSKKLIISIANNCTLLGIQNLYANKVNSFSAIAIEASEVYLVDKELFISLLAKNSAFASKMIERMSLDTLFVYNKFLSFTSKQIDARLANVLLYLVDEVYNSTKFKMTLSRQDIAELTGVAKETVTRTLADFDEKGLIKVKAKEIEVLDKKALKAKANDSL